MKLLRPTVTLFMLLSITTGLIYPLVVMGIGWLAFPNQVQGSLLVYQGKTIGSALIGQHFTDPKYFWGRPSATSPAPYTATASGGSNLGPLNPLLIEQVKRRAQILRQYPSPSGLIPVDLITASASGIDPHISLAAALYQIPRIAKIRGLTEQNLHSLVNAYTQSRKFGLLGEPIVHVLQLNLSLDQIQQ